MLEAPWSCSMRGRMKGYARLLRARDSARAGFAVDVGDGKGPEGNEVDTGYELAGKRRQKLPVPAEQPGKNAGHADVEEIVGGRIEAFDQDGEKDDLEDVSEDGEN